ncbi:MAG: hypothetical protein ABIX12_12245 [Rubrivivax sp.]
MDRRPLHAVGPISSSRGIGRLRSDGRGGYDWLPTDYQRARP